MPKKGDPTGPAPVGRGRVAVAALDRTWNNIIKREGQGIARELIEDPVYLEQMRKRLRAGRLHPQIQVMLWAYGYGKPKELVEVRKAVAVRIVHEYLKEPEPVVEAEAVAVPALTEAVPSE